MTRPQDILPYVALCVSVTSLVLVILSLYYFAFMGKTFRHKLIMILLLGDLIRSMGYIVGSSTVLVNGHIEQRTKSCQSSGFLIQLGNQTSDFSIFFVSVHIATQLFFGLHLPHGHPGLKPYKTAVFNFIFLASIIMAGLPFATRGRNAYMATLAFCWLPRYPLWYRLALSWVPRLFIWISMTILLAYVLSLAWYIRNEGSSWRGSLSQAASTASQQGRSLSTATTNPNTRRIFGSVSTTNPTAYKLSGSVSSERSKLGTEIAKLGEHSPTQCFENRGDSIDTVRPSLSISMDEVRRLQSLSTAIKDTTGIRGATDPRSEHAYEASSEPVFIDGLDSSRRARQKKLKAKVSTMFIYPCLYLLLWLPPAVHSWKKFRNNATDYSVIPLVFLSIICRSAMGGANAVAFLIWDVGGHGSIAASGHE